MILEESHHDQAPAITTRKVVEDYLSPENTTKQSLRFFRKIALPFGVDTEKTAEKARLWDRGLSPAPALVPDVFQKVNGRTINLWCARAYGPDSLFGRRVEIYGFPHPRSWIGFGAEDIVTYLKPVFEDCCG